jgi:hypothetical protein
MPFWFTFSPCLADLCKDAVTYVDIYAFPVSMTGTEVGFLSYFDSFFKIIEKGSNLRLAKLRLGYYTLADSLTKQKSRPKVWILQDISY